jgi:hypothetical protein
MRLIRKIRFSMRTIAMLVLTAAVASALFAKIMQHTGAIAQPGWKLDAPSLFLVAIGLTALALGSWKEHTAVQTMLQMSLTCVGCLVLIWIGEAQQERALRYWFQGTFAATVSLPMLARRIVKAELPKGPRREWWKKTCDAMVLKAELPKGPRREWWKKTCEAMVFSFLNMMLVTAGGILQGAVYVLGTSFLVKPGGP